MKQTKKQIQFHTEKSLELANQLLDMFVDRHGGEVAFALAYVTAIVMHDVEISPQELFKTIQDLYDAYDPSSSEFQIQ